MMMSRCVLAAGLLLGLSSPVLAGSETGSITLPGKKAFPESLTATADGTIYAGNLFDGGVLRIRDGKAESFVEPGAAGTRSIEGVYADEASQTLWVCSNDYAQYGATKLGNAEVAVKGFDLRSGKPKISLPLPGAPNECNDMAVDGAGNLYVSETAGGRILRLTPGSKALEVWLDDPRFHEADGGPDGIAFGAPGQLYINTYGGSHLFRIELVDGKPAATELALPRPFKFADGMRRVDDHRLVMVEGSGHLDLLTIDGNSVHIDELAGTVTEPAGVVAVGSRVWISEAMISYMFDPAKQGRQPPLPWRLRAFALPSESGRACADAGLTLPPGFCASVVADDLGHPRHMIAAPDGTLYVNTWSGGYYPNDKPRGDGYVVAIHDGKVERFGPAGPDGGAGGTGIALYEGWLYVEESDAIVRYRMTPGKAVPSAAPEIIVSGLPLTGEHPMHQFAIDPRSGALFVNVGALSNACEVQMGNPHSPGFDPCTELKERAGIWTFDASKKGQVFSAAARYATGIRNIGGMQIDGQGRLFVTQHGRDRLFQSWPDLYDKSQSAELPAEELLEVKAGGDYGWPTCYFDGFRKKLVLAPEYGGDGGHKVGVCAGKIPPVAFFPGHWAPNDLLLAGGGATFPAAYREGVFVAFHGSWNRAPLPQAGFRVVFQPMKDGKASGDYIVFADGFAGKDSPDKSAYRPTGLAFAPDGALYISDDNRGRLWKIVYQGPADAPLTAAAAPVYAPASEETVDAAIAALPLPPGVSRAELAHGASIYSGEDADGTCGGCHGADGSGSAFGADFTAGKWQWSDGSLDGIAGTIRKGVAKPKTHQGAMPPMGGAALAPDDVKAIAAYVWALAHQNGGADR